MVGRLWRWLKGWLFLVDYPQGPKETVYSCYYVTIHFASAEDAAAYTLKLDGYTSRTARIQRGGETLRMCKP